MIGKKTVTTRIPVSGILDLCGASEDQYLCNWVCVIKVMAGLQKPGINTG